MVESTPDLKKQIEVTGKPGHRGLFSGGFLSVLGVSFFGAANDNILKQILTLMVVGGGIWANVLGEGTQGIVSLVLTVPFIFLSGYAGQVADRFSKRTVILWVKIAEIPIAVIAMLGLLLGNFWLSLFALLLLAIQSSFYGPAKFGVIPDVVEDEQLSQANGLINAITNIGVILGSVAAGPLADMYYPTIEKPMEAVGVAELANEQVAPDNADKSGNVEFIPDPNKTPNRWAIGLALVLVSIVGLGAATLLPRIDAVDPNLQFSANPLRPHIQTFEDSDRPLTVVLLSWSGFYMIATLALLMLPDYRTVLGGSNTDITNLLGLLALSIGIGSVVVGFLSGNRIRPYYALVGAGVMTLTFLVMGLMGTFGLPNMSYHVLFVLVILIGISAGFYIVPLQSLLQYLSPDDERGRFFGTANALSFLFISAAGLIYYGLRSAGLPAERVPLFCALFAITGTISGGMELRRIMNDVKAKEKQG